MSKGYCKTENKWIYFPIDSDCKKCINDQTHDFDATNIVDIHSNSNYYKCFCEDEKEWVYTLRDDYKCPNDSKHTVTQNSLILISSTDNINNKINLHKIINKKNSSSSSSTGIECVYTSNGSSAILRRIGQNYMFTSSLNNNPNSTPHIDSKKIRIWSPSTNTSSNINIIPGSNNTPDYIVCSKFITSIRVYLNLITPTATTGRGRVSLLANNSEICVGWLAPLNGQANSRTTAVLESGGIQANTNITVMIDGSVLPNNLSNADSYFVIQYEL